MTETPPPAAAAPLSESDERLYATLSHAGIILFGFLPPLIFWLVGKDRSAFVDTEAKEALNFSILVTIGYVASTILIPVFGLGLITGFAVWVIALIFCIQAAIKANKHETYRYPLNWRLIK
ncbi:DUF4870 domain-containing protein [Demequina sp. TTPB684]|uniref:DUF4870 domain-containing protein n=1 Tax=unclassified Demequina TaxID=2620311 RepID=UPI001CF1B5A4|nr:MULTISPECIES: DUF4870 domain-containing protein [unclassified Demequina]MCB2413318.1 DUF4870 domain-containing protein [Demequina sp. TTPB684]UPU88963.1 DUF4870 domain-containing protein [Demequina sp. TMPB413]